MPQIAPFQNHVERYENWFSKYPWAYEAELQAVESLLPKGGRGVEVGVGTGRFASRLGVTIGVEPAGRMAKIAQDRGVTVLDGVAERLPFSDSALDYLLMVTTVCFVDDACKSFQEAHRVLRKNGCCIVAFVDSKSPLGQGYAIHKNENIFYKDATFYSVAEIIDLMRKAGFDNFAFRQTIFQELSEITANEPVEEGYGKGSFVVVRGRKK